ncbi:FGGY-family carbohydrate kinase [Thiomicrorhabdus aquaedulcis]|uniref:FGGY-family carbohydrate kinase n=1 Tax=Thiomicrorhabdus aquaedulcis TaxID=2211106 RepID=UPI000FD9C013|nr:FGGY family carbohydrate kinase [Thiomicrorhabdus aquaedulcis]
MPTTQTHRANQLSTETQNATKNLILGIDVGTSGLRACLVQRRPGQTPDSLADAAVGFLNVHKDLRSSTCVQSSPQSWLDALTLLLDDSVIKPYLSQVAHIVVDATSSTVLLCSQDGQPRTAALMYNDQQAQVQSEQLARLTDSLGVSTAAQGASSTLAKVRFLQKGVNASAQELFICHQIDYVNHYLADFDWITDENNALKLGYDSVQGAWPGWVSDYLSPLNALNQPNTNTLPRLTLPKVVAPGTALAHLKPCIAQRFGLNPHATLYAGTTDSIAGFLAAGASQPGDAVTSLGSTLALKMLSPQPIFNAQYGIYSHRLKDQWLVGGASNSGGAVLLAYFSLTDINDLMRMFYQLNGAQQDALLNTAAATNYYPLTRPGERFPIASSRFSPKMPPPVHAVHNDLDKLAYFMAMVQGLVNVENTGYQTLHALGAPRVKRLYAVGGGLKNPLWVRLRQNIWPTQLNPALSADAAFGVTQLISL